MGSRCQKQANSGLAGGSSVVAVFHACALSAFLRCVFRKPVPTFREHAQLAHHTGNAAGLVPRPRDLVLEITARARTKVALPHISPRTASVVRLAGRLACSAG